MKDKILRILLYITNAFTIQYLISYGRFEKKDYLKLILISIVFLLSGYVVKHYEKKINANAVFFLAVALGFPFIASIQNGWLINWAVEVAVGVPSFLVGFFISRLRWAKGGLTFGGLVAFVLFVSFYINPRLVYAKYLQTHSRKEIYGKPISFNYSDTAQARITNESLKGKIVLLDYWFIGCSPCYLKMRELKKLADYYKDNKEVVIITVNAGFRDSFENFSKAIQTFPPSMVHVYDSAAITAKKMNLQGYPTEFLIDKNGIIRDEFSGYSNDISLVYLNKTKAKIDALLTEK